DLLHDDARGIHPPAETHGDVAHRPATDPCGDDITRSRNEAARPPCGEVARLHARDLRPYVDAARAAEILDRPLHVDLDPSKCERDRKSTRLNSSHDQIS